MIVYATAWYRCRRTAATLADLIESAVDLHGGTLAAALGLATATTGIPELGAAVTTRCRKGAQLEKPLILANSDAARSAVVTPHPFTDGIAAAFLLAAGSLMRGPAMR